MVQPLELETKSDRTERGESFWSILEQVARRRRSKQKARLELLKRKVLQLAAYHRGILTVSDLLTQDWCDLEEANHCFQDLQVEGHCHFRATHQDRYVYVFPNYSNS